MTRPKFEGSTREQRLLSAARQVKHDLLSRAEIEDDGGKVVNLSAGVWVNLCNTLREFEG